jgi:uncharacterized protein (TIGR03118 family)
MFDRLLRKKTRLLALIIPGVLGVSHGASVFVQTNLVSDVPGMAANLDPNLKNPWGVSFSATSPFWVSDQVTNVATLYNGAGVPQALVVSTPPNPGGGPTGQVFAGGQGFTMAGGLAANFIFSTLSGTIDAWNSGSSAVAQFTATDGAVYTGLALAGSDLYAADTVNNRIDVFGNTFAPTTVTGSFVDPNVALGFTPYNIQNIGGKLYVEYAKRNSPGGFIGVFDTNGNFLQNISDSHLNSPWGITLAPATFGTFGGDLLIGNFGDGTINAFTTSGSFVGTLSGASGSPLVNSGLWSLNFRAVGSGFDPNTLFISAGINGEADGLFAAIQVAPEPGTWSMLFLAIAGAAVVRRKYRV